MRLCVDHESRKIEQKLTHWVWPLLKPVSHPPGGLPRIPRTEVLEQVDHRDTSKSLAQPPEPGQRHREQAGD